MSWMTSRPLGKVPGASLGGPRKGTGCTGNPGPDYDGSVRLGDNLYSDCVIALDADTGRLKWHFQFTPHDVNDMDSNQIPILLDASWKGTPRKLMLFANRNAFYYVLDRVTGEFLHASQFTRQTWAKEIDARPPGEVWSNPISYRFEGEQYISVASGTSLM